MKTVLISHQTILQRAHSSFDFANTPTKKKTHQNWYSLENKQFKMSYNTDITIAHLLHCNIYTWKANTISNIMKRALIQNLLKAEQRKGIIC